MKLSEQRQRFGKAAKLLVKNPALLGKIGYAHLVNRVSRIPAVRAQKEINGVKFEFDFGYGPQIRKMYFDLFEPFVIAAMKHFLKEGDTFVDVGANIGFLSAIAAGLVGKSGEVHSFEPVPRDFERLQKLALTNSRFKIVCNPFALGQKKEILNINVSNLWWVGWNTLVPNFMKSAECKETIPVEVKRLDEYLQERNLNRVSLIKIDTEGFEFPVLKGLENYFKKNGRPPIICELTPAAYELMGFSMRDLANYMDRYGYKPCNIVDLRTRVDITKLQGQQDIVFLPN